MRLEFAKQSTAEERDQKQEEEKKKRKEGRKREKWHRSFLETLAIY